MSFTVSNSTDRTCDNCGQDYCAHGKALECPATDSPYMWKGNRWTEEEMKSMKALMCESQRVYEDGRVNYRVDMAEPIDLQKIVRQLLNEDLMRHADKMIYEELMKQPERPEPIDPEPPKTDDSSELDSCKQAMTEIFTEAQLQDIYVFLYNRGHRINR